MDRGRKDRWRVRGKREKKKWTRIKEDERREEGMRGNIHGEK